MRKRSSRLAKLWLLAGLCVIPAHATASADEAKVSPDEAPRCEIDEKVDVMALVHNDRAPDKSMAMIATASGGKRIVHIGGYIHGRAVLAILPHSIWLGPVETPCWMPLSHEGKQVARKSPHLKKKKKRRKKKR